MGRSCIYNFQYIENRALEVRAAMTPSQTPLSAIDRTSAQIALAKGWQMSGRFVLEH